MDSYDECRKMALFSKLFSGTSQIELRTFDPADNSILFSCAQKLAPGQHNAQALVADHKMRCVVRVDSVQAGLYYGHFLEPRAALDHLAVLLPMPLHRTEKRSAKRVDRGLRVTSSSIPKFVAVTSDFSASGIKIKTEGPMTEGDEFPCQVEFDDETMSHLDVLCKVIWCRPEEDKFLVGASFENLPKAAAARIAYFVDDLTRVDRGTVSGIYQFD